MRLEKSRTSRRRSWLGCLQKGCTSLTPCKAALAWLDFPLPGKISYLPGWNLCGWTSPLSVGGLAEAAPPTNKPKYMAQFHAWACEAARRQSRLGRPQKGCLAKSALCLPGWTSSCLEKSRIYVAGTCVAGPPPCRRPCGGTAPPTNVPHMILRSRSGVDLGLDFLKRLGWTSPCLQKSRTYLAGTCVAGPPRCLGAALWRHCPSHKRSKVDGTIPRIAKQPRRRSRLGRHQQSCTSSARLPCQISRPGKILFLPGWNLCGDIPAAWGLVEALPLPQTKQSRWHNSTHGLAKQPGVDLGLDVPKKAALPNQPSACLVGLPPAWKNLVFTWLELVWLDLPAPGGRVEALPLPQTFHT